MIYNSLVSVVIINFNSGDFIWRCLECLNKQTYKNLEILIIDNNSDDGSSEALKNLCRKNYYYHKFDSNVGSSVANNYGIKNSSGNYILILNADVFLKENYIEESILAFRKDHSIGTVTGKLLSDSEHDIIDTTGIILYKEGVAHERGMGEVDVGQYDTEGYVIGACCAAAIYKREMLDDIRYGNEYYDEDYFAFVEDLDLSVCATLLGWKTFYTHKACGYHVRGGSTSAVSEFVQYLNLRNSKLFFNKYLTGDKVIYTYHFILTLLRYFTVKKDIRKKIRRELSILKKSQDEKRNFYKGKMNKRNIKPFIKRSYILDKVLRK